MGPLVRPAAIAWYAVSTARLWLVLAALLPALAALLAALPTVDLAYHLRAGAEIISTGRIPTHDTWTFTATGEPWLDQQWGAQIVLRAIESTGGWAGLAIARAVFVGAVVGGLALIAVRRGLHPRTAALLALAGFAVMAPALALRPQLLGLACFVAVLAILGERRRYPRLVWMVPVIVALWANVHGSFFLGPILVGLAWLEDFATRGGASRTLVGAITVSAVAACLTPFGPGVWAYAASLAADPDVTMRVGEWQPTALTDPSGVVFYASGLAVAALVAARGRSASWPVLLGLVAFFVLTAYTQRAVIWWAPFAVVAVAGILAAGPAHAPAPTPAPAPRTDPPLARRLNLGVVAALGLAIVALLPTWRPLDPATGAPRGLLTHAPSGVTGALRDVAGPGDRILNPQGWGSWLEYAMPETLVAVDARIELFPSDVWRDYEAVMDGGAGWEAVLDRWAPDLVVTTPDQSGLRSRLLSAGWMLVHDGADGAVLRRVGPSGP